MGAEDYDDYDEAFSEPEIVACKYCGEDGLHWELTQEGWRLFDNDGDIHRCDRDHATDVVGDFD